MVRNLATDPYVPKIGTVPTDADEEQARAWVARQHDRLTDGVSFSFCDADATSDDALRAAGLWLRSRKDGRASAGYSVAPRSRGRSVAADALIALTNFAWTMPDLHHVELYVEPWNTASLRTAKRAGYERERLLRSHQWIGDKRADMLLHAAVRP